MFRHNTGSLSLVMALAIFFASRVIRIPLTPFCMTSGTIPTRVEMTGVPQAIELHGRFALVGNIVVGFDEPESAALSLHADRLGRAVHGSFRDNVFESCRRVVREDQEKFWTEADARGNLFLRCDMVPQGN